MKTRYREIFARLKAKGHRLTKVRKTLIEFILKKEGHWTIHDLALETKASLPQIGVATLYRTVALLLKENVLSETRFGGGSARYEVSSTHHHDHLTCVTCGQIFEFENSKIEHLQEQIAKSLSFKLTDHRMELFGECQKNPCQYRPKNRENSVTQRQKTGVKL